jgi:hypothetical protein
MARKRYHSSVGPAALVNRKRHQAPRWSWKDLELLTSFEKGRDRGEWVEL